MRTLSITAALICLSLWSSAAAEEKLSMSDADKAMYAELLESNPAEMEVAEGEQLFSDLIPNSFAMPKCWG
jgi:L-cysteine S-thiosulfotransferase